MRKTLESTLLKCRQFVRLCEFDDSLEEGVKNSDTLLGILVQVSEQLKDSDVITGREIREIRNKKVHSTEANKYREKTKSEKVENWKQLLRLFTETAKELEQKIGKIYSHDKEIRSFEKFGDAVSESETDRKQIVDALADEFSPAPGGDGGAPVPQDEEKLPLPENNVFERSLADYLKKFKAAPGGSFDFVLNHEALRDQVQKEILNTARDAAEKLSADLPSSLFFKEKRFIERVNAMDDEAVAESFSELRSAFETLPTAAGAGDIKFDFFAKRFPSILSDKKMKKSKRREKLSSYVSVFKKELKASFQKRYEEWAEREAAKIFEEYNKKLLEKIENFKKLENLLSPLIDEFSILWNMADADGTNRYGYDYTRRLFQTSDFNALLQFAAMLEKDRSIRDLAELLGRSRKIEERYEKELRDKVVIKTEYHPAPAYKGQINGITQGDDISSLLPSELALYKHPATRLVFCKKFAEKQLLQFKYETLVSETREEIEQEEILKLKEEEKKGPVIICVDTSGSMSGAPEAIAKTVTFALTKIALKEKRKCYLISFSTAIETLDLTDTKNMGGIGSLINFLNMSFNGGTDATPALNHSLKLLETEEWMNADVLMVSDFQMNSLPGDITQRIKDAQSKKTRFHSLVIGNTGNQNAINCFDNNWVYNPTDSGSQERLVRQLRESLESTPS